MPSSASFRLLVSGTLGFALIGAIPVLYGVALPAYRRAFDLSEGAAGLLLTTHSAGAVLVVCAGMFGLPWLTMRLALGLLAAGSALLALQWSWAGMLAGALAAGLGFGLLSAIVNRRFLSEFGARGAGMVPLVNALFGLGAILSPLAFVAAGERAAPVFAGLAVLAIALWPVATPTGRGMSGAPGLPDLRRRRFALLALNFLGVSLEVMLMGFGPTALIALGATEAGAARLASGFFAAFLLGRLALFWLARLAGPGLLFGLAAAGVSGSAAVAALGLPAVGYVAAGAFTGALFPLFYVWGSSVLGGDPRIGAAILTAGLSGGVVAPAVTGLALGVLGAAALFAMVAGLAAVVAGVTLAARRPLRRMAQAAG